MTRNSKRAPKAVPAVLLLALAGAVSSATGNEDRLPKEPNNFTWGELALLPEYCRDTMATLYQLPSNPQESPRAPYWVSLMGKDFWHMHHYCWGLREMLRHGLAGKTPQQRRGHVEQALLEYAYVVRNVSPTMILMPEVYLKIGEAHLLLGDVPAAAQAFATSRSLKPDYWPSYQKWIDVLVASRQYEQALQLARQGLAAAPDSPEMKKLLSETEAKASRSRVPGIKRRPVEDPSKTPNNPR